MHPPLNLEELRTLDYDFMLPPQQQQQQQQPQPPQDGFGNGANMGGDLDMFANAQFFDFDMGEMPDNSLLFPNDSYGMRENGAVNAAGRGPADYINAGDFNVNAFPGQANALSKLNSAHTNQVPNLYNRQARGSISNSSSNGSSPISGNPTYTTQPKAVSTATTTESQGVAAPSEPQDGDEAARVAAEEDKRRRNTAASARFRVKKKQREQALEKIAKEMTDRVTQLETKVSQLEMENKILKNLITEKSGSEVDMDEVKRKVIEATPDESPSPKMATKEKERKVKVRVEKASPR